MFYPASKIEKKWLACAMDRQGSPPCLSASASPACAGINVAAQIPKVTLTIAKRRVSRSILRILSPGRPRTQAETPIPIPPQPDSVRGS